MVSNGEFRFNRAEFSRSTTEVLVICGIDCKNTMRILKCKSHKDN